MASTEQPFENEVLSALLQVRASSDPVLNTLRRTGRTYYLCHEISYRKLRLIRCQTDNSDWAAAVVTAADAGESMEFEAAVEKRVLNTLWMCHCYCDSAGG